MLRTRILWTLRTQIPVRAALYLPHPVPRNCPLQALVVQLQGRLLISVAAARLLILLLPGMQDGPRALQAKVVGFSCCVWLAVLSLRPVPAYLGRT